MSAFVKDNCDQSARLLVLWYALSLIASIIEIKISMRIEKVVIIIPTYNEAAVIQETLEAVFNKTQGIANADIHVLVFDSASTDNTQRIVTDMAAINDKLHLKTELKKSGLGSAYLQAMHHALTVMAADIVFEFDADLSHQPKYIAPMLEKIKAGDVVVGSRYAAGGRIPSNWGWHRKVLSVLGNWVARAVLTPAYKDFTSGFRATRRDALQHVLPARFLSNNYAYKLQLLWLLHKNKSIIYEHPIEFIDREKGTSKLPANSVIDSLRVVFTLRYYELKRYLKMCLVGFSGMMVQFLMYNLCREYLPPFNATQLAVSAAIINNFILNSHFTFKQRPRTGSFQKVKKLSIFLGYSVAIINMQSYWLAVGVKLFGTGLLIENAIMFSGMILGSLLNYFIYSRIVWREHKIIPSSVQPYNNIS